MAVKRPMILVVKTRSSADMPAMVLACDPMLCASIPCACANAKAMLHRAGFATDSEVLVPSVPSGVKSVALHLAKLRSGRYISSSAIAGPILDLDRRDIYLKDIWLIGTTAWDEPVFPNLIRYIEGGEIRPLLAATWPLGEIAAAQEAFARKDFVGNFVLIPPEGVAG